MLLWLNTSFGAASQRKKINPSVGSHPLLKRNPPWRKRSRLQSHPLHPSQWKCWRTNVATVAAHLWHSSTKDRCPTCLGLFTRGLGRMAMRPWWWLSNLSTWLESQHSWGPAGPYDEILLYIHSLALIFWGFLSFHATEQGKYRMKDSGHPSEKSGLFK